MSVPCKRTRKPENFQEVPDDLREHMYPMHMNTATTFIAVATVTALSACGGASSVAPSSAPTTLAGHVSNAIAGPLDGARVTVTAGPSTGAFTVTDSNGDFRLAYDSRSSGQLEVTKADYAPTTVNVVARSSSSIDILLHSARPPVSLSGVYALTFTADAACTQIPEALRTRSYSAVVVQPSQFPQNTAFDVTVSGGSFVAAQAFAGRLNSFFGFVEANAVDFRIENRYEGSEVEEGIREEIAPDVLLEIRGEAKVTGTDGSTIAAPLSGSFTVTDPSGTRTCASANHAMMLSGSHEPIS